MAITVTFQTYSGATPAWMDIPSGKRLIFAGSPRNLAIPLRTWEWNLGMHLGTANPGADACGVHHVPNVRYMDASHFDGGAGSEVLSDANLAEAECTLRIKVASDAGAVTLAGARLYVCDVFGATRAIPDVEVQAFERGVSATAWTQINDGESIGGDNSGERLALADKSSPATEHYYYIALSARPLSGDALPIINLGFYLDTVSGGAYAQRHTQACRMTYTSGEPDYEVWVIDNSGNRRGIIADLLGIEWELGRRGSSSFSFTIPYDSNARDLLDTYDLVKIKRGNGDLLDGRREKPEYKMDEGGLAAATIAVSGRDLSSILDERVVEPDAGENTMSYTGRPDDAMKHFVRYNFVAGSVVDTDREFSGLTCQPDRAEAPLPADPDEQEFQGDRTNYVLDICKDIGETYGVDFAVRADGAGGFDFDTYYPRLGVDRSDGNAGGNREVVLTVTRENLRGIRSYKDMLNLKNHWYVLGFGEGDDKVVVEVADATSISTYRRREAYLDMGGCNDEALMGQNGRISLNINKEPITGIEVTFQQTEALKFGRDFWLGDYLSVYFDPFDVNLDDDWELERVRGKLNPDGTETLELTLGRVEPSLFDWMDRQKSGGGAGAHSPVYGNVTTIHPQETMSPGNGTAVALNDHVHGAEAAAPAGAGYSGAAIVGSAGDSTKFVHSNHEHPLLDAVTPADIAAAAATGSNNHVARRDHVHKCARYNHSHTATATIDGATAAGSQHRHAFEFLYFHAKHCHDTSNLYVSISGTHYPVLGGLPEELPYHAIRLAGFGGYGGVSGTSTTYTAYENSHTHEEGTLAVSVTVNAVS